MFCTAFISDEFAHNLMKYFRLKMSFEVSCNTLQHSATLYNTLQLHSYSCKTMQQIKIKIAFNYRETLLFFIFVIAQ